MPRASTRRSEPSGLNDTTVPDHSDFRHAVVAGGRDPELDAAVGGDDQAPVLARPGGERDHRALAGEAGAVEAAVGVDPLGGRHVELVAQPQQAEGGVEVRDHHHRRRPRRRHQVDGIGAGVPVVGGGDPQPAVGIGGEGGHLGHARRVEGGGHALRPPQAGADVDQTRRSQAGWAQPGCRHRLRNRRRPGPARRRPQPGGGVGGGLSSPSRCPPPLGGGCGRTGFRPGTVCREVPRCAQGGSQGRPPL